MQEYLQSVAGSWSIAVSNIANKGRGTVATRFISKNETIFVNAPIVALPYNEFDYDCVKACSQCMTVILTPNDVTTETGEAIIPEHFPKIDSKTCQYCDTVYCSYKCQSDAWTQHHQYICTGANTCNNSNNYNNDNNTSSNNGNNNSNNNNSITNDNTHPLLHLKARKLCEHVSYVHQMMLVRLLARMKHAISGGASEEEAVRTVWLPVASLCTSPPSVTHVPDFSENVRLIKQALRYPFVDSFLDERKFFDFSMSIQLNAVAVQPKTVYDVYHSNMLSRGLATNQTAHHGWRFAVSGIGLYPLTSFLNHNCNPNAHVVTNSLDSTHAVVALRDIEPGEEICISYIHDSVDISEMHTLLKNRYLFDCTCQCIDKVVL